MGLLRCGHKPCCIIIALFTIVQSGFHLYGIIYINWWRYCTAETTNDFLTYVLGWTCNNVTVTVLRPNPLNVLEHIGNNSIVPINSNTLDNLMMTYLVLDAAWIVAAVALLMGSACRIKENWALVYYIPWIVLNVLISLYDAFCAIFFGLHFPKIGNFSAWLDFIGINLDIADTNELEGEIGSLVTGGVSILMIFVSARGGIVWVLNLVLIIFVVKAAKAAYKEKYTDENGNSNNRVRRSRRNGHKTQPHSASARIRNWHMFYGPMDDNPSLNEVATNQLVGTRNLVFLETIEFGELRDVQIYPSSSNSEELPSTSGFRNSAGLCKSDEIEMKPYLGELRRQIPWTYLQESDNLNAVKLSSDNNNGLAENDFKNYETVSKF